MFDNIKKVLCLAPHSDDCELGLGGTISRLIEDGKEVYYVAFSTDGVKDDVLIKEIKKATKKLGLTEDRLILFNYPTRTFNEHRQEILDDMIKLNSQIQPDLVFLPSTYDTHQDHQVVSQEGFRAFKKCSILGYEEMWNNMTFPTTGFVRLEDRHVEAKVDALSGYQSQSKKMYMYPEFTRGLAMLRGAQINTKYAEAFEIVRFIL
jgi:LmbE family N-acetylglucosaminyl deacetylase